MNRENSLGARSSSAAPSNSSPRSVSFSRSSTVTANAHLDAGKPLLSSHSLAMVGSASTPLLRPGPPSPRAVAALLAMPTSPSPTSGPYSPRVTLDQRLLSPSPLSPRTSLRLHPLPALLTSPVIGTRAPSPALPGRKLMEPSSPQAGARVDQHAPLARHQQTSQMAQPWAPVLRQSGSRGTPGTVSPQPRQQTQQPPVPGSPTQRPPSRQPLSVRQSSAQPGTGQASSNRPWSPRAQQPQRAPPPIQSSGSAFSLGLLNCNSFGSLHAPPQQRPHSPLPSQPHTPGALTPAVNRSQTQPNFQQWELAYQGRLPSQPASLSGPPGVVAAGVSRPRSTSPMPQATSPMPHVGVSPATAQSPAQSLASPCTAAGDGDFAIAASSSVSVSGSVAVGVSAAVGASVALEAERQWMQRVVSPRPSMAALPLSPMRCSSPRMAASPRTGTSLAAGAQRLGALPSPVAGGHCSSRAWWEVLAQARAQRRDHRTWEDVVSAAKPESSTKDSL